MEEVLKLLTAAGGGAGLVQIVRVLIDRAQGVKTNEIAAKTAAGADWAGFVTQIQAALAAERAENARDAEHYRAEAEARDRRLAEMQEQVALRDRAIHARDAHITVMDRHIWEGKPPPPPDPPIPY